MTDSAETSIPLSVGPGTRIGSYELIDKLGEGGMGIVFKGRHVTLEKTVAIKILPNFRAPTAEAVTRFIREGKAAAKIRHPHVVDVADVGVHEGMFYMVMELLQGQTLTSYSTEHGRLTPEQAAEIMLPVLSAVAAAHDVGIVHRDLKPENIFLCTSPGGAPHPKVLDFGIAREIGTDDTGRLTDSNSMVGTPIYMSPEQVNNSKHVDAQTDQYSLGVVLFELVTGVQPFARNSLFAVLNAVASEPTPCARAIEPSIPESFDGMLTRAMDRNPANRFASLRDLGAALLEFASPRALVLWEDEFRARNSGAPRVPGAGLSPPVRQLTPHPWTTGRDLGNQSTLRRSAHERSIDTESLHKGRSGVRSTLLLIGVPAIALGIVGIAMALRHPTTSPSTTPAARARPITELPSRLPAPVALPPVVSATTQAANPPIGTQPAPPPPGATTSNTVPTPPSERHANVPIGHSARNPSARSTQSPPAPNAAGATTAHTTPAPPPATPQASPAAQPPTPAPEPPRRGMNNAPIVE